MPQADLRRILNQRLAQRLLEQHGWTRVRGGKHVVKMTKPGQRPIKLPHHHSRDYSRGLTNAILKQAGLAGQGNEEQR